MPSASPQCQCQPHRAPPPPLITRPLPSLALPPLLPHTAVGVAGGTQIQNQRTHTTRLPCWAPSGCFFHDKATGHHSLPHRPRPAVNLRPKYGRELTHGAVAVVAAKTSMGVCWSRTVRDAARSKYRYQYRPRGLPSTRLDSPRLASTRLDVGRSQALSRRQAYSPPRLS